MRQRWANLLFLHWVVEADSLQRLLPPGLTLDTFEGNAYIGLVPFTMTGVRPIWAPPFKPLSDFHETNLRTYVHLNGANPGVWFFSLDAANSIAVKIARTVWKLPYHRAEMRLDLSTSDPDAGSVQIDYETNRLWPAPIPAQCTVSYIAGGPVTPARPETLEHFLAERYLLYAYRGGKLYRGQVNHVPYPLQAAQVARLSETITHAAGIPHGDEAPLAHYASEVNVEIFPLRRVG